jgi:hypothetical protein
MAEWGFSQYRTALYHYPYLPWTFVFSVPFYCSVRRIGFYDQRVIYLLLYGLVILLAARLATGATTKLALAATLALNPIMALDVIFGQNDVFVLAWIIFALVAWQVSRQRARAGAKWHKVAGDLIAVFWAGVRRQADGLVLCSLLRPVAGAGRCAPGARRLARILASYARDLKARLARHRRLCAAAATLRPVGRCRALRRCLALEQRTRADRLSDLGVGRQQFRVGAGAGHRPFCAVALSG